MILWVCPLTFFSRDQSLIIDHQAKLNDQVLQMMDEKVKVARRQQLKDINEYRIKNQRRTSDLYDPKKDFNAKAGEDESKVGVSSGRKFEGEDLTVQQRQAYQKQQMRIWAEDQIYEKQKAKQDLKSEEEYIAANKSICTVPKKYHCENDCIAKCREPCQKRAGKV